MPRHAKLQFAGASGAQLAAVMELPAAGEPQGYALFAHCFTCTKDIFSAREITRALAAAGWGVLRFDFTGLGESEGDFASSNFSSNVADLVAAAAHMASSYAAPRLLVGHSLGGSAILAAAGEIAEAVAVCTIGAPADPAHVEKLFTDHSEEIRAQGEAEVLLAGRPFVIQRQFLQDIAAARLEDKIATLGKALLICHAPGDATVGIDNARRIFDAARHPKSFLSLDGADHLLGRRADARYVASTLAAWVQPYLARASEDN